MPGLLRALADRLWALHSNVHDYVGTRPAASVTALRRYSEVFTSTVYRTEHPVVHVHPETGEHSLILGQFVQRLLGFNASDSAHLLAILQDHIIREENTVRWRWSVGDVAIWDNRATQHSAIAPALTARAAQQKVTVAYQTGAVPYAVGIADGSLQKATGWQIDFRRFNSGAEIFAAIASGDVDLGDVGSSPLAAATSNGLDVKVVYITSVSGNDEALVARGGSRIRPW